MSQAVQTELARFARSRRLNVALTWLFVGFLVAVAVGSAITGGDLVWDGFATVVAAVTVAPAAALREPQVMLPWEVIALASFPLIARILVRGQTIGGMTFIGRVSMYLTVATIALVVAVELDVFTPTRTNHSFAVFFVAVATMATAGVWTIVQWLLDLYLGTRLLLNGRPEHVVGAGPMWGFAITTVAGLLTGLLLEYCFRRRAGSRERLSEEVAEMAEGPEVTEVAGLSDAAETDGDSRTPEGGESP